MEKLCIVTDSTADLPRDILKAFEITVVPLKVMFGDEVYRDGVDITSESFFNRLVTSEVMPTTSQPSPGEFVSVYEKLLEQYQHIISIHLSSELSGTVCSAQLARDMVDGKNRISVIDSKSVSLGLGLMVLLAAKAVKAGKTKEIVLELIEDMINKITVYFLIDTLDYLERGGRIGKAESLLGSLLNIKPILTFQDGVIYPYDKVRGQKKAIKKIIDSIEEQFGQGEISLAFVYGTYNELFETFKDSISSAIGGSTEIVSQLGPVVGTHGGPGIVGVVGYGVERIK